MKFNVASIIGICIGIQTIFAQNPIAIPDTLSGTSFQLNVKDSTMAFYAGFSTQTMGINAPYLGPTLLLNQGDSISIEVHNGLMDTTTIHWHGLHVAAENDGGPHITIAPGATWNPKFTVRDHAATYWYHPHMHMMTNLHATLGAAGMIIVRDPQEAALALPRKYGQDDFPLVIQTKCFDASKQIVIGNASDSVVMVNGTLDPSLALPAQVVRLRLLNATTERVLNLGLEGNRSFYQIGTDGGLLDAPVSLTRLRLASGERAEILVDLSNLQGQQFNLISFASELPNAMYGATQPGMGMGQTLPGYSSNPLNGTDFAVMQIQVSAQTANPVLSIPSSLIVNSPYPTSSANANRTLTFTPQTMGNNALQGPFLINGTPFDMNVVNYTIPLDNIEIWTLTNQSPIAHPFHIHDVQFYITDINGAAPPANMRGRKDVVLVPAMQTVQFITKFETFCDPMHTYMYHCHMLTHEDDGMMGQFRVSCPTVGNEPTEANESWKVFPNPGTGIFQLNRSISQADQISIFDANGKKINLSEAALLNAQIDLSTQAKGAYWLRIETEKQIETLMLIKQ